MFFVGRLRGAKRTRWKFLALVAAAALVAFGCASDEAARRRGSVGAGKAARWSVPSGPPFSGKCRAVAVADFNGDSLPDLVTSRVAAPRSKVEFWYGDGRGNWIPGVPLLLNGDVRSISTGDLDRDGWIDVALAVHGGGSGIKILMNRGDGSWKSGKPPISVNSFQTVMFSDINQDGNLDVAAARTDSDEEGGVLVFLGDGKGGWIREVGPSNAHLFNDLAIADVNRDGREDIVASGWGPYAALRIWMGTGTGRWAAAQDPPRNNFWGLDVADINQDGNPDVVVCVARKGIHVYLGDGRGGLKEASPVVREGDFWDVLLVDLDNNGLKDIVASSFSNQGLRVWYNRGGLNWRPEKECLPFEDTYYGIAAADLDVDGRLDILACSSSEGLHVFLQGKDRPAPFVPEELERIRGSISAARDQEEEIKKLSDPLKNKVFTSEMGFEEYRVGPGDQVKIIIWQGVKEKDFDVVVRADGKISFFYLDELDVDGLTPTMIDQLITRKLKEYIMLPRVEVVVTKYLSKSAAIFGEVKSTAGRGTTGPGSYPLTGKIRLLEFITHHGGPTAQADLSNVEVIRTGARYKINLHRTLFRGDMSQNVVLDAGDVIHLPKITEKGNRVYVFGEVKKPGVFNYQDRISLLEVISKAGGLTMYAVSEDTKVIRGDPTRPEVLSSDLIKLIRQGNLSQNINLANNDIVYVPRDKIGDVAKFLTKLAPILQFVLYPAAVRDAYIEEERELQFSIGGGVAPAP